MPSANTAKLRDLLSRTIGPTPWYWKRFPTLDSRAGQKFVWRHGGEQGSAAYVVSLALEQELDTARLALNTYCRPFAVPPHYLGIWCPEGRSIRITCFDPDQLKSFDLSEVAGWFKPSSERIYSGVGDGGGVDCPDQLQGDEPG
jgi:hypothetical protein